MDDPVAALVGFADRLPTTIREVVLFRCCLGLEPLTIDDRRDYREQFASFLEKATMPSKVFRCAMMIGAMEFALREEEVSNKLWREHGNEVLRDVALRAPLRARHWKKAQEEFRKLRKGPLGNDALHKWQMRLLSEFRLDNGRRPAP